MSIASLLFVLLTQAPQFPKVADPLSVADARSAFQLPDDLIIELVASDPQIEAPVASCFDERGRLWVVEMRDYPNGPPPGQPPSCRVKILTDANGDGFYETSSIFADELSSANGLLRWKTGVIVTAAPTILYLPDDNDDGKADRKETLWQGFSQGNPQLRVSHPAFGLDQQIYVANGLQGGTVRRSEADKPIPIHGMDFSWNPLTNQGTAVPGMGQFGNTIDPWNHRFVCDNRHHLRHVVFNRNELQRNNLLAPGELLVDTSLIETADNPAYSGAPIFPISKGWTTSNLHAGRFTAACGIFAFHGTLLGPRYTGVVFTCDPTGNIIHGESLERNGATFRSRPITQQREFLATKDEWFRPVSLNSGPDGALYVVDMYRAVIEHPEWMPVELKQRPDLLLGKEKGRIWRIRAKNFPADTFKAIDSTDITQLVSLLAHPNDWHRRLACRLLLASEGKQISSTLRSALTSSQPLAVAQALWLLHAHQELVPADLTRLLAQRDLDPQLLEQVLALSGRHLVTDEALRSAVAQHVQRIATGNQLTPLSKQLALTLSDWADELSLARYATNLQQEQQQQILDYCRQLSGGTLDRWTQLALLSAIPTNMGTFAYQLSQQLKQAETSATETQRSLLTQIATMAGASRDQALMTDVLRSMGQFNAQARRQQLRQEMFLSFTKGLKESGRSLEQLSSILAQAGNSADGSQAIEVIKQELVRLTNTPNWNQHDIALAVNGQLTTAILAKYQTSDAEQKPILLRALMQLNDDRVNETLIQAWKTDIARRTDLAQALLARPARTQLLLQTLASGEVSPDVLDPMTIRNLLKHPNAELAQQARKTIPAHLLPSRDSVFKTYRTELASGQPQRGKLIFAKHCATCHRIDGVGHQVGPDISDLRTKTPEQVLLDIVDPNAAIDANYQQSVVELNSGETMTGIIATETTTAITLKRADGKVDQILRSNIANLARNGMSFMPEGQEKNISKQEMADLISYVKNWRYQSAQP